MPINMEETMRPHPIPPHQVYMRPTYFLGLRNIMFTRFISIEMLKSNFRTATNGALNGNVSVSNSRFSTFHGSLDLGLVELHFVSNLGSGRPRRPLSIMIMIKKKVWFLYLANPQQGDLRLSGPPSGYGTGGGARTRDRGVPADLRADSLATVLPAPLKKEEEEEGRR
ncbi:hypothetical protein PoB_005319100 [Plakobranchus ocellatus]|uniref:Uncharacterized protein n=1 Tax=Plakobranchus ocellatus TaxID=259542 RepID=A0AAV4C5R1_9GAST|nr:hypothetical protein PoB_005319100 [Plakobranchus ocellatus]